MVTVSDGSGGELCYYLRLYDQLPAPSAADYLDVPRDAWYYSAVDFAVSNGYLSGTSRSQFSPQEPLTRAMLAQVLYQAAGRPESGLSHYADVPEDAWCFTAVSWVSELGIMSGSTASTFDPERPPARQELATALYRFAQHQDWNTQARADLSAYADAGETAPWPGPPWSGRWPPACWPGTARADLCTSPPAPPSPGGVFRRPSDHVPNLSPQSMTSAGAPAATGHEKAALTGRPFRAFRAPAGVPAGYTGPCLNGQRRGELAPEFSGPPSRSALSPSAALRQGNRRSRKGLLRAAGAAPLRHRLRRGPRPRGFLRTVGPPSPAFRQRRGRFPAG